MDVLEKANQKYWQILPIGPTSYGDSPYQSFSTFAGNPYFISLEKLIEEELLTEEECNSVDFGENNEYIDYEKLYEEYKTLEYTSSLYVEDLAFAKSEIMQWYNKSLELGTLYQEEIQKSVTYHSMYQQTHKELMAVLNSKGWKFLEKIRKIKK